MSETGAAEQAVEAAGETVGEAKWAALRELEKRFPGLDREAVEFEVLSEGERGILGVGQVPARVVARLAGVPPAAGPPGSEEESQVAAFVRELVERICRGLDAPASIAMREQATTVTADLGGPNVGLLIGKHGQTIDAIQYLANALAARAFGPGWDVVVDASGYRARRQGSLERAADRAAAEAVRTGEAVPLEPMTSVERKIVHVRLADREDVETASEGAEPNRHVVVTPRR
jgi:spoIIIJ-associated protein